MDERFENLEIKVAYLERMVEELDDVVRSLSDEVSKCHSKISELESMGPLGSNENQYTTKDE